MAVFVVGYYLTYAPTHALMKKLGIDNRSVADERLHYPLNNWLAETEKLDILAGSIIHPSRQKDCTATKDGILFMSRFFPVSSRRAYIGLDPALLAESDEDRKVKIWLVEQGGVNSDELEWMQMWDTFNLTLGGFKPFKNNVKGRLVFLTLTDEEKQRYMECRDLDKLSSWANFVDPERLARAKAETGLQD